MGEQAVRLSGGARYSDLQGKVVLVTGSSRGIGAAIARAFASQGAAVALHGRDTAALDSMRKELAGSGGQVMQLAGDVTRFDQIENLRHALEEEFGALDVLIANAGGSLTPPGPLEDITEEGWRASVDANLTATFLTIKSFLPGMKARKAGSIITVSSSAARRPHPRSPIPYAAAKAGIQMLTQHLAAQVGPYGIRVNCIAPETILTERSRQWISEEQQRSLAEEHPLRRLGSPEDVARAALFLASDESGWITGTILDVTGGAVMV